MSKPIRHTVNLNGVVHTRKSPRTYTHAIVGHRDRDEAVASCRRRAAEGVEANWGFYVREANPATARYANQCNEVEYYAAKVALGRDGYLAKDTADRIARSDAAGYEEFVLQWSQSAANARKAVGTFVKRGYHDVRVVTVTREA